MAQQQAPAVGEVMDGYRFKGGDPAQQSSWEQVAPVDVSSEYGAGARRLPNGVIERVGPRGGVQRIGAANGGTEAAPMVGADARARFMINLGPLQSAQANMERMDGAGYNLDQDWGAAALEAIPFDGGFAARVAGGEDYNAYTQAAKTFEAAIMPIMSGAAVTPSEAQRLIRAALPQPGDSPEVLAQKSEQRRQMINAVAQGIGQDAPYADPQTQTDEYGLPDYGIEGGQEIAVSPVAGQPPAGPTLPGSGPDAPIDISGLSATDLMALQPGQYLRFPDGRVERLSGAPRIGASGEEVAPGVFQERMSPEQTLDARREDQGLGRRVDAFVRGAADTVTFGLSDEITAGLNTVAPLDRGTRGGWNGDWRGAYSQNLDLMRGIDAVDSEQMPITRGAGQLSGAVAAPGAIAGGRWVASAPSMVHGATRGAAAGALAGGLYGAGNAEGGVAERVDGARSGAMVGGIAGAALPPLARATGAMTNSLTRPFREGVGDLMQRFGGRAMTGEDRAVRSMMRGVNPDEAAARLDEGRRFGAELTAADVGGSNVQGRVRVAATRQTPGREVAQDFAAGRRSEVQDFAAGLGERVSPLSATPQQLDNALEEYQRNASREAFGAVRGDRVTLNRDSIMALRSDEGRAAVRDAARLYASSTDEAERNVAAELNRLADLALDNPGNVEVTVGAADLMARHLVKAGGMDANRNRVFGSLGRTIRDDARTQNTGYDEALTGYAARARLGDAVETGDRFLGRGHTGDFVEAAGGMDDAQRGIARAAARAGIERASETGGSAPGLLDKLATGRGQQARSAALLGPDDAADLQQGARVGRRMVDAGNNVNPRAGSNTFLNSQDGEAQRAGGIIGNALTGRFGQAAGGVIDLIRSAGISDAQAETIVRLATDPSRTEDVLQILRTRFPEQEARRIVSELTPAIAGQAGAASAPQQPRLMTGPRP